VTARIDRRLVAVMFTDMVGYTTMMQTDERLALDKRARYASALDTHHDARGGTIVQRLGPWAHAGRRSRKRKEDWEDAGSDGTSHFGRGGLTRRSASMERGRGCGNHS
jgi:class 3 adenylate cyclase